MSSAEMQTAAMVNRSIRTIKAELEYLCDAEVISPETLSDLLSRVPPQTALRAPISVGATPSAVASAATAAADRQSKAQQSQSEAPSAAFNNLSLRNNSNPAPSYQQPVSPAPPSYNAQPPVSPAGWAPLAQATALYAYSPTDPTDLELQPNDHIAVTEYMNAEWWKGKSSRTGREGIFPKSYVRVVADEKYPQPPPPEQYGNGPLAVSGVGDGSGTGKVPSKAAEFGKKAGGKLGNAVIFGAGATLGADMINSIF